MHREDALFGEPLSVPPYVPPQWYLKLDIKEPLLNSYSKCFEVRTCFRNQSKVI